MEHRPLEISQLQQACPCFSNAIPLKTKRFKAMIAGGYCSLAIFVFSSLHLLSISGGEITNKPRLHTKRYDWRRDGDDLDKSTSLEHMFYNVTSMFDDLVGTTSNDCLQYSCDWDLARCTPDSNNTAIEDYYHPNATEAPCCVDILRQLNKNFDEEMCAIGLDYTVMFGSLLGLQRGNDLIPWSNDNDYLVHVKTIKAMIEFWNATRSGISLVHQDIYRMCANKHLLGGKLNKWEVRNATSLLASKKKRLWTREIPYIDLYAGFDFYKSNSATVRRSNDKNATTSETRQHEFAFQPFCCMSYQDIWPSAKVMVRGDYEMNFPAKPLQVLHGLYGPDWRTPDNKRSKHGDGPVCSRARCNAKSVVESAGLSLRSLLF